VATIIAFPEVAVQGADDLLVALLDTRCPRSDAARHQVVQDLLARAFDESLPLLHRLDLAGHLALAHGSRALNARVLPLLEAEDVADRQVAALILGWRGNLEALFPLVGLLDDDDLEVQRTAVVALAGLRDHRVLTFLLGALERGHALLTTVLSSLRLFAFELTADLFRRHLDSPDADASLLALGAHMAAEPAQAAAVARRFLAHADRRHRCLALSLLERHGRRSDLEALLPLRLDVDPVVRRLADEVVAAVRARP
jgi:HEAT repeat protein